jgi:hypothetical protein
VCQAYKTPDRNALLANAACGDAAAMATTPRNSRRLI